PEIPAPNPGAGHRTSQIQLGFSGAGRKDLGAGPAPDVRECLVMRSGLIVPPGLAVLSFAPLSVFEAANGVLGKSFYEVHAVSVTGGRIPNSFGMELETERVTDGAFDT